MIKNSSSSKIPLAIWALTFCAFGIGTTEFVLVGLLPTIAKDLGSSIYSTGSLITLYALGVAIGGPFFSAITVQIEHKKLLLYTIIAFIIGNTIAFFADNIRILEISRIITGTTHGVFFGYAVVIANNMVSESKKATAISLVFAGLMIATVLGVPIGSYIGSHYGWKVTFGAVAVWGILGLIILAITLPKQPRPTETLRLKDLPKVLQNTSVLIVLSSNIFAYAGTFVFFTYLSPTLESITGFSLDTINFILLIFGVGVALGNMVGGRISNQKPSKVLVYLFTFHAIIMFALTFTLTSKPITIITLLLFGFFAYSNVPALQLLVVRLTERKFPGSGGIASALNVSAFNIGAATGSFIGSVVLDSNSSELKSTPLIGSILVATATILGIINWNRNKNEEKL